MFRVLKVADFMNNHIVDASGRSVDKVGIQSNLPASPALPHRFGMRLIFSTGSGR